MYKIMYICENAKDVEDLRDIVFKSINETFETFEDAENYIKTVELKKQAND